jgi:hypothetical protein
METPMPLTSAGREALEAPARYILQNDRGAQITRGTFAECNELRLHHLDIALMKRFRLLSRIYDNRAGAIAFRTAMDRRSEAICMRLAKSFREQLAEVRKEIAYYRLARPEPIAAPTPIAA